jgi:hypothetical protein
MIKIDKQIYFAAWGNLFVFSLFLNLWCFRIGICQVPRKKRKKGSKLLKMPVNYEGTSLQTMQGNHPAV